MTPLKPIANLRVRGVASTRYPLNTVCSMPDCTNEAVDPHHIWPRSLIIGDSWFVEIGWDDLETAGKEWNTVGLSDKPSAVLPHVTGLCRQHHEAVESHAAWIRLEDGQFNWYDRSPHRGDFMFSGSLNPQPGSREGRPKRPKRKPAEPGRPKAVYAVRVPKDELENGHAVLTELVEQVREKLGPELGWTDTVGAYFVLVAALVKALQ